MKNAFTHYSIFTVLILLLSVFGKVNAQCPTSSATFVFTTQQQVDDFGIMYADCNDIVLRNVYVAGDVTNLNGLSHVKGITDLLSIWSPSQLADIGGLSSLESVEGDLWISNAPQLANIDALSSLQTVGGSLNIQNNDMLADIDGLSGLSSTKEVSIYNNPLLTNLDALSGLVTIGGKNIYVIGNSSLINISGLQNIDPDTINGLYIQDNAALSVCNLPNFCTYLSDETNPRAISGNAGFCLDEQAVNYHCLPCPTSEDDFTLNNQQQIDDFGAMYAHCTDIVLGSITISGGDITNLDGLSHITGITGSLVIQFTQLTNLEILSNLTSIGGNLSIGVNASLTNLNGLSNITTVGGNLEIKYNSLLINVKALSNLIGIEGGIDINNNPVLSDISGLTNIAPLSIENLSIVNNTALSVCDLPNFCTYLSDESNPRTISGNAGSCLDEQAVSNACFPCPTGNNYTFATQQQIDDFGATYTHCTNITLGNVSISGNDITNLDGLSNITDIGGNLIVAYNPQLTNLNGLSNVTDIGGNLTISNNPQLANLNGLSNVTNIGGNIALINNTVLANLDGLSNVTGIGGDLYIQNNTVLTDISGLQNIDPETIGVYDGLYIVDNPSLSVCNLPNFCEYLSNPANTKTIGNNATDCISPEAVTNACAGSCGSYKVWNGNSWIAGEPGSGEKVFITGEYSPTTDLEVCELEVAGTGKLTIPANVAVTVNGKITNNAGENNFIVENDGNLIQVEDMENEGAITVKRNSTPMMRLDYAIWSSPVEGQGIHAFSPETVASRIYIYEGEDSYQLVPDLESDFIAGKSYMFRAPNNWNLTTDANGGNPVAYPGEFKGVPFNGGISINVYPESYTSVGNPYASNLNLGSIGNSDTGTFLGANPEVETLYFWTNTNPADGAGGYTGNNWATYTLAGGASASGGNVIPEEVIAPGQGFIISSTGSGTSINFNNTMRTSEAAVFFKNEEEISRFRLNLKGDNSDEYNQILIGYMDGATYGIDNQIDGKMFGYEGSALYNLIDAALTGSPTRFTIQGRPLPFETSDVVPLGFRATENGKFIISLTNYEGIFADEITIYVKDNVLGITHNLMESDYEFESAAGEFNDRFEIVYGDDSAMGTDDLTNNSIQIYKDKEYIVIDSQTEKILSVELYDLSGRNLYRDEKVNANHYRVKSLSTGIIVVKVQLENGEIVTKKIINK